ncbi:MAG: ester cyclase [Candidatus Poribacteria bacterium]|nr:ester cyclase [Candidatus Poribacteria bacterium]MDE0506709.1 ester cyclase [Candidatus Poribacteria bacterium]
MQDASNKDMERKPAITRLLGLLLIIIASITLAPIESFVERLYAETTEAGPSSQNLSPAQAEYRALLERFYDSAYNLPNQTEVQNLISPDYIDHNPVNRKSASGIEGLIYRSKLFRTGFPDLVIAVEDFIVGRGKIVARIRMRGTHQGEFMGLEPTDKQIDVSAVEIYAIVGEKISERWGNLDGIALFRQLGVIQTRESPKHRLSENSEESTEEKPENKVAEQPNLTELNDWEPLKAAFMHEIGRVRIVALVSPN